MIINQEGKRTQIQTVLDDVESTRNRMALAMVQGSESFSLPYTIDMQIYADRTLGVPPASLINTPATIRLRVQNVTDKTPFAYQVRKGIFQTFSQQPRVHFREPGHKDLNLFMGRLVPAFLIMAQEVRYRIFENMTVVEIIKACMGRFQGLDLGAYISEASFASLAHDDVSKTKVEHTVQYGESTFNFLSRLMNRCSIWYTFDHDAPGKMETMIIGKGPKQGFPSCSVFTNFADPRDLPNVGRKFSWEVLTGVVRTHTPSPKLERVGEFNTVKPTAPLQSSDGKTPKTATVVTPQANIINTVFGKEQAQPSTSSNEPKTSFIQESFPDLGAYDDGDASEDAQTALEIAEAQVEVLSGISGNASFMAGRVFRLSEGEDEQIPDRNYLITQMSFAAYDRNYLYIVEPNAAGGLGALLNDIVIQPFTTVLDTIDNIPSPDVTTALATTGLADYVQGWYDYASGLDFSVSKYSGTNKTAAVANYTAQVTGNVVTAVAGFAGAGVVPLFYTVLQDLVILVEKIVDGVLKVIALVLEGIAVLVLGIAAIIQKIMHKPTTLGQVLQGIDAAERWLEDKIHPFFRPKYVDAYSASFNATAVARPGQRQGAGIPLPVAQKTVINGPHLATVIGPTGLYPGLGSDGILHGIYADKLGRVRIRFPWDRSPFGSDTIQSSLGDKAQYLYGENTVWVRVSDAWAGGYGFGSQFLPRVGDEVIVSFVDGDPDRPVITGRLYNPGRTGKPNLPFPVSGPTKSSLGTDDDGQPESDDVQDMKALSKIAATQDLFTRSGIKTRSTPPSGPDTPNGFHMLRFEDKVGKEQLLLRSQGRLDVTALGTNYHTLGGSYHLTVGGIDTKHQVAGGNYIAKVLCDYTLHVGDPAGPFNGGHRYELVEQDYDLHVKKKTQVAADGDCLINVGGDFSLWVGAPVPGGSGGHRRDTVEKTFDLHVKDDMQFKVDGDFLTEVAGSAHTHADFIVLEARKKISFKVGNSFLIISPAGVYAKGPIRGDNSGGAPISAFTVSIKDAAAVGLAPIADPVRADAGNT